MEYLLSLAGGLIIGVAALVLWLGIGRIMGMSGILGAVMHHVDSSRRLENLIFVLATVAGGYAMSRYLGIESVTMVSDSKWLPVVAGLLVGVGTGIGSGCTSGHGICGLSRFSMRSLVATLCFMGSGVVTLVVLHLAGVTL